MNPNVWVKLRDVRWPPLDVMLLWSEIHVKWRGRPKLSPDEFIVEVPMSRLIRSTGATRTIG